MAADRVLKELEIFSERPAARSGHRSCATTNHILTYGGYDRDNNNVIYSEVLSFNTISKKWVELPGSKDIRGDSASCSMVLYGENLIVYGGSGFPFGHSNSNDLSAYSLRSKSWSTLRNDRGSPPLPNYGQSMVITTKNHAPKLYTFSGTIGREFLDDMHYYDLEKKVWYRIWGEDAPEARYRHEAVVFGDDFYIFGGATYGRTIGFENIWKFNFISHKWTKLECKPSEVGGMFPDSRKAHSCVLWKDTVYMCGGIKNLTEPQNDIWKISLTNLVWEKVNIVLQTTLYFHSAAVTTDGCMYIFGGVDSSEKRTSSMYELWLTVPSLLKLSIRFILNRLGQNCNHYRILYDLGVPKHLLDYAFTDFPAG